MTRKVSASTRAKLSEAMKGKRNAAGKHTMSQEGRDAISKRQKERWKRYREDKESRENQGSAEGTEGRPVRGGDLHSDA